MDRIKQIEIMLLLEMRETRILKIITAITAAAHITSMTNQNKRLVINISQESKQCL